jgi:hypothetical protein
MQRQMRAQRRLLKTPLDMTHTTTKRPPPPDTSPIIPPPKRLQRKTNSPRPRRLSPLEALPTELLTHIFLLSAEINLARATHFIGSRLSCRSTYLAFIRRCIHQTWDHAPDLSACRFFTRDFIQSLDPPTSAGLDCLVNQTTLPLHRFRGPWDPDRLHLLDYLLDVCRPPWRLGWHACADLTDSINDAVAQRALDALWRLFRAARLDRDFIMPQTVVRDAVLVHGCVPDIVLALFLHSLDSDLAVDCLDTPLWAWAELAGSRGEWLTDVLTYMNHLQVGSGDAPGNGVIMLFYPGDKARPLGWWRVVAESLRAINRKFGLDMAWLDDVGRDDVGHRSGLLHGE